MFYCKIKVDNLCQKNFTIIFKMAENELNSRIFSGKNRNNGAVSLREQFEVDISELGDKIHQLGLEELEVREKEIKVFEESLEIAREESQRRGVVAVRTSGPGSLRGGTSLGSGFKALGKILGSQ